jgi:hypothetical protein
MFVDGSILLSFYMILSALFGRIFSAIFGTCAGLFDPRAFYFDLIAELQRLAGSRQIGTAAG